MKSILIIGLVVLIAGCSRDNAESEKMAKIYVDLIIAKETFPGGSDTLLSVTESIFEKYNITSDHYFSTLENFKSDQKKWDEFFELSRAYLDSLKNIDKVN